jgi:glycosyltransferase involved in cell wall biosynthesis
LRVLYISYDGILDPLGTSQVLRYLLALAKAGHRITLLSFEKPARWAEASRRRSLADLLTAAGIEWLPGTYHKTPRVSATLWDVLRGAAKIRGVMAATTVQVVHCRGDVAAFMARLATPGKRSGLLYDIRGFFSDERVESGSWRRNGVLDRLIRSIERGNLRRAVGLVTLTHAAVPVLKSRRSSLPPHRVIPTCADTNAFRPRDPNEVPEYGFVYAGSLSGVNMGKEIVAFLRASTSRLGRTLVVTPEVELAHQLGFAEDFADVRPASPEEVPRLLRRGRASVFFNVPGPGRVATCPTKFAEALATGLPVAANRGIGDLDEVIGSGVIGTLVSDHSPPAHREAIARIASLLDDPETSGRCRRLAERSYSLSAGVAAYQELYAEVVRYRE